MGLIGSLVGGVAGAIGAGLSGSALGDAYRKQQKMYDQRMSEVRSHRDAVYYQDPTQSAENQAAVTNAQKVLAEQGRRTRATNIVTGGTDESEALQKAADSAAVGNMLQQQAVQGAAKKEQAYQSAEGQLDAFTKYKADSVAQQGQAKAQAIQGAFGGLSQAAGGLDFGGQVGKTGMTW